MRNVECGTGSFTLIELMTVMAIILVLVGLLLPALNFARTQAKKHLVRTDVSNMTTALKSFRTEYGYWPDTTSWGELSTALNGNIHPYSGAGAASGSFASNNNPKAIRFLEFKTNQVNAAGQVLDPWGTPYIVMLDHGGTALERGGWEDRSQTLYGNGSPAPEDGMVNWPNTTASNIQSQVAIYSCGQNKVDNGGDNILYDDILSWMP
jgi:type II secretory pathway pseudopilin PulG